MASRRSSELTEEMILNALLPLDQQLFRMSDANQPIVVFGYLRIHFEQYCIAVIIEMIMKFYLMKISKYEIDDKVRLHDGMGGIIRYIGINYHLPWFAQEELIGIELDSPYINAGNGSICGYKLFSTEPCKAYFVRSECEETDMIHDEIEEGRYARLKGLVRCPANNGKIVRIKCYVKAYDRWKGLLLDATEHHKKYAGAKEENLTLMLDSEALQDSDRNKMKAAMAEASVGERLKVFNKGYGTVKYIGKVGCDMYVGFELEEWDPNAHNGTVNGLPYFDCRDDRGYFVKLLATS